MTGSTTNQGQAPLHAARLASLDELLRVLDLQPSGTDRFSAAGEPGQFPRTFGGQLLAQALVAAGATIEGKVPASLHANFAAPGTPIEPVSLEVRRVGDGRAVATRDISLRQGQRTLLTMIASFHDGPLTAPTAGGPAAAPGPAGLPTLQDWVAHAPEAVGPSARSWIDHPPPIEIRIAEAPVFLGGAQTTGSRSHWMRLARPVTGDASLQAALLAHASDYLLLDMAFRSHPVPFVSGRLTGASLDHSIWFHRPVRFDRWHRYHQETVALTGERGLVRGAIHDEDGHLIASTAQDVLVRVADEKGVRGPG
ncbi:MAG: acyl-CoA thioesterase [Acidimicrobiales bacterium]